MRGHDFGESKRGRLEGTVGAPRIPVLYRIKAAMFLVAGGAACVLILIDRPTLKCAFLLAVAVWCFCRLYYFAFYVIERYVDPGYRFSGLGDFVRYLGRPDGRVKEAFPRGLKRRFRER